MPKQLVIQGEVINTDLSITPRDPAGADGYQELYKLWCELGDKSGRGEWKGKDDAGFAAWNAAVLKLLRKDERQRFDKPLRPELAEVRGCRSGDPSSRVFHLTKILWARQGIERHMPDTGF